MAVLSDIFRGLVAVPAAARTSVHHAFELSDRGATQSDSHRTLLYGAGWAGVSNRSRSAQRTPAARITPVGFLDDHLCLKGSRAQGLPIFGDESAMAAARRRTHASSLLITMPHAPGAQIRRVVDAAAKLGLPVRTVPGIAELLDRTVDVNDARPVALDDLLRGPATTLSSDLLALVEGHTIMVTGAGGRIGSEIARRLVGLKPARIVMVDRNEHDLSAIGDELQCVHQVGQGSTLVTKHLVDITDRAAISVLIGRTKPVAILHAATLGKGSTPGASVAHVTRGNISGTRSLVGAAADRRVARFVLVSTDDAREPLVRPARACGWPR